MNIDNLHIGESSETLQFQTSDQHREASIRLIQQAKRSIRIHSYDLEPKIYNNRILVAALRSFVAASHRNKIEILIHDSSKLRMRGHQLVDLARQFSSFVQIKKISSVVDHMSRGYIIADNTAIVQQAELRRYEGSANFNDRKLCKLLCDDFNAAWLQSSPDPELRRLHI